MVFNEYDVYMINSSNKDGLLYNETRRVFTDISDRIKDVVHEQVREDVHPDKWVLVFNGVWVKVNSNLLNVRLCNENQIHDKRG